jgi:broad specificity phosphatase PhoE
VAPHLILIRHSLPEIEPAQPPTEWRLSSEGDARCRALAEQLARFHIAKIAHSLERKSQETAQAIGCHLKLPCLPWPNLHEHVRANEPYTTKTNFEMAMRALFMRPNEVVYGSESGQEALERFSRAINDLVASRPILTSADSCAVSHGTVISLFTARHNQIDAFTVWKRLTMPCAVILRLPDFHHIETIKIPD